MNTNSVVIELLAPLIYFYVKHDIDKDAFPIELGNDFQLIHINKDKIRPLIKNSRIISSYEQSVILDFAGYAIYKKYYVTREQANILSNTGIYKEESNLLSLLKMSLGISKGTNLTYPVLHIENKKDVLVASGYDKRPAQWHYKGVEFDLEDFNKVKMIVRMIKPLNSLKFNRVMNACVYFEHGRLSNEYIIRFLMFVSALESLFNSSTDHISETISLRCSNLVGNGPDEKLDYYHRLKDVYKMRSYLVHGQDLPKSLKKESVQDNLISDAEFFARNSLLYIASNKIEKLFSLNVVEFNEHFANELLT